MTILYRGHGPKRAGPRLLAAAAPRRQRVFRSLPDAHVNSLHSVLNHPNKDFMAEPTRRRTRPQRLAGPIDWSMIFRAYFVWLVAGVIAGGVWGYFGGSLSRTLSQTTSERLSQSIWLYVLGFVVG